MKGYLFPGMYSDTHFPNKYFYKKLYHFSTDKTYFCDTITRDTHHKGNLCLANSLIFLCTLCICLPLSLSNNPDSDSKIDLDPV